MKQVGGLFFAIGTALGLCFVGTATASLVMKPQESGMPLKQMDVTSLWTVQPVRVDPSHQALERVASIAPVDPPASRRVAQFAAPTAAPLAAQSPALSAEHLAWCAERYRTYDAGANTYRSYSGQVRTCVSPYAAMQPAADQTANTASALPVDHLTWCAGRYRSYRAEDNTYRAYSGERRDCVSPHMETSAEFAGQP